MRSCVIQSSLLQLKFGFGDGNDNGRDAEGGIVRVVSVLHPAGRAGVRYRGHHRDNYPHESVQNYSR